MAEGRSLREGPAANVPPLRADRPVLYVVAGAKTEQLPPEWRPVVVRLGLTERQVDELMRRACRNGTSFQVELFASTLRSEADICREIARELGLSMTEAIDPPRLVMSAQQRRTALAAQRCAPFALLRQSDGQLALLLSPASIELPELCRVVRERPGLIGRLRIVVPSVLRRALIEEEMSVVLGLPDGDVAGTIVEIREAEGELGKFRPTDLDPGHRAMYLATSGLLEMRAGRIASGTQLYWSAFDVADIRGDHRYAAWARLYFARELHRAGVDGAETAWAEAQAGLAELRGSDRKLTEAIVSRIGGEIHEGQSRHAFGGHR
jgi:hypothetical protein